MRIRAAEVKVVFRASTLQRHIAGNSWKIVKERVERVPPAFQVVDERLEWNTSTLGDWLTTQDLRVSHNRQGRSSHTFRVAQPQESDKVREVIRLLEKNGWRHVRTSGDHRVFRSPDGRITVVSGATDGDIRHGTYRAILSQTGIEDRNHDSQILARH